MPSTRKQKAKERRSRQLDFMFDVENVDVMLGSYSRNDEENDHSENEINSDSESSRPQRTSNVTGEDFWSYLTNSRENIEITIETTRMINGEISNQMSRKPNSINNSLNSQIQNAITVAKVDTVLPFIQNALEMQGRSNFTVVDRASNGLHPGPRTGNFTVEDQKSSGRKRNSEAENAQKRKRGKIVLKGVLHGKIVDKCLERVQPTPIMANKIATWWQEPTSPPIWFLSFALDGPCNPVNPSNVKPLTQTSLWTIAHRSKNLQAELPLQTPSTVLLMY